LQSSTNDLARKAVAAGICRYCAVRRERVPEFVHRHFSLRGTLALHRAAVGWDILRTPVNLTLAAPAAGLHLAARGARRIGARRVADTLGRRQLLLRTSLARRLEWLICTELLELPCRIGKCQSTRDALAEAILAEPQVQQSLQAALETIGGARVPNPNSASSWNARCRNMRLREVPWPRSPPP
jgi:hypothetical protein